MTKFDNIKFPKGEILNVEFLPKGEIHSMIYREKSYIIFSHDFSGVYYGVDESGAVYFIDTDEDKVCYVMNTLKNFVKGLKAYRRFGIRLINLTISR